MSGAGGNIGAPNGSARTQRLILAAAVPCPSAQTRNLDGDRLRGLTSTATRLMGSVLFPSDLLSGHEPVRRFMESLDSTRFGTHWDQEPSRPSGLTRTRTRSRGTESRPRQSVDFRGELVTNREQQERMPAGVDLLERNAGWQVRAANLPPIIDGLRENQV